MREDENSERKRCMVYELQDLEKAGRIFGLWEETMIWSGVQGVIGKIYVTDTCSPVSAMAVLGKSQGSPGVRYKKRTWNFSTGKVRKVCFLLTGGIPALHD